MWWVYYSPLCRELRQCGTPNDSHVRPSETEIYRVGRPYG
jgi:hypothetical protein